MVSSDILGFVFDVVCAASNKKNIYKFTVVFVKLFFFSSFLETQKLIKLIFPIVSPTDSPRNTHNHGSSSLIQSPKGVIDPITVTLSAVSNVCSCDSKKESAVNSSSVNLSPDGAGIGSICVEEESFTIGDIPHSSNNCPKSTDIK